MYNIFPFDNSISKMQLSGVEVRDLFNFVARRSSGRGCVSQVQIAGARIVIDCGKRLTPDSAPGIASNLYIGVIDPPIFCTSDEQCPGDAAARLGACDVEIGRCWQAIDPIGTYELATSNYLAGGGSGFRVLQRNTTQFDTQVQQRDALIDYIRAGAPCGSDADGELTACSGDGDCAGVGTGFVCACPSATIEGGICGTDPARSCGGDGRCVLAQCRDDVAGYQRETCNGASNPAVRKQCEESILPCASAGEQCKFLACIDRRLGNASDGRLRMIGQ
jgi:5'-nucleotidase / UDP-sugar diphosphatase